MSDQGLIQLRAWKNGDGDAIYSKGELGEDGNQQCETVDCIEFLHIDVWSLGDSQMKSFCI